MFVALDSELAPLLHYGPTIGDDVVPNVDFTFFVTLGEAVLDEPSDRLIDELTVAVLQADGEEGPWITAIPDRLTAALAGLSEERLDEVAATWWQEANPAGRSTTGIRPADASNRYSGWQLAGPLAVILIGVLLARGESVWRIAATVGSALLVLLGVMLLLERVRRRPRRPPPQPSQDELLVTSGWAPGGLIRVRGLAQEAEGSGRSLFLWQSL